MRTTKTRPTGPAARPTWVRAGRGARAIAELDLTAGTIGARPIAAVLAGGTGTGIIAGRCGRARTLFPIGTVSATALAVRVATRAIAVALGRTEGSTDAT